MSEAMYIECQVCSDVENMLFPGAGRTGATAATIGDMLAHHASLHDEDATVEFVVSVAEDSRVARRED